MNHYFTNASLKRRFFSNHPRQETPVHLQELWTGLGIELLHLTVNHQDSIHQGCRSVFDALRRGTAHTESCIEAYIFLNKSCYCILMGYFSKCWNPIVNTCVCPTDWCKTGRSRCYRVSAFLDLPSSFLNSDKMLSVKEMAANPAQIFLPASRIH